MCAGSRRHPQYSETSQKNGHNYLNDPFQFMVASKKTFHAQMEESVAAERKKDPRQVANEGMV
jgi:hypothetical protein